MNFPLAATFEDLARGQTFDWIDDSNPGQNSFFEQCRKVSARCYVGLTNGRKYTVGTIKARVFHVEQGALPSVQYLPADRIIAAQREPFSARNPYAMGYGRKIPTDLMVRLTDGRSRRVYVMQFSNAGSAYVLDHGQDLFVGPEAEERIELLTGLGFPAVYWGKLDSFTRQYLETALRSSNDESDESGGEPMDRNYGIEDISPQTMAEAVADCAAFRQTPEYREFMRLFEAEELEPFRADSRGDNGLEGSMGHDFWLTRNGHGAGFWDGDYPDPWGDKLTEAAKRFGEIDLTVYRGRISSM